MAHDGAFDLHLRIITQAPNTKYQEDEDARSKPKCGEGEYSGMGHVNGLAYVRVDTDAGRELFDGKMLPRR